jgi:putative phosphoribosyl transferase
VEYRFRDRCDAGRSLAAKLRAYENGPDALVLALPRGGVPVGFEVAARLSAPLDVFVVRKLGLPWHEELAVGAIASGGVRVLDRDLISLSRMARIVVAVPVSAPETCDAFRDIADEIVCAETPEPFQAVGQWYEDFSQITDAEVHDLLARARGSTHATI